VCALKLLPSGDFVGQSLTALAVPHTVADSYPQGSADWFIVSHLT